MAGTAAVEKNALVFFALFSALRERRCTPREVSMVDDVDDEEVGMTRQADGPHKLQFELRYPRCRLPPKATASACASQRPTPP